MINHYIVWLDISVHYPHTVAIVKSLKAKKKRKKKRTFRFYCLVNWLLFTVSNKYYTTNLECMSVKTKKISNKKTCFLPLRFRTCRTVCQSQIRFDTIAVKNEKQCEPFEAKIVLAQPNWRSTYQRSLPWSLCCSHVQRPKQEFETKKKKQRKVWDIDNLAHTKKKIKKGWKLKLPQDPWRYLTVRWYLGRPLDFPRSLFLSWFSFSWPAVKKKTKKPKPKTD